MKKITKINTYFSIYEDNFKQYIINVKTKKIVLTAKEFNFIKLPYLRGEYYLFAYNWQSKQSSGLLTNYTEKLYYIKKDNINIFFNNQKHIDYDFRSGIILIQTNNNILIIYDIKNKRNIIKLQLNYLSNNECTLDIYTPTFTNSYYEAAYKKTLYISIPELYLSLWYNRQNQNILLYNKKETIKQIIHQKIKLI